MGYPDPETFHSTYTELAAWLDGMLAEHGIPPERTVLGGFSQGSVMSYALGLGPERPRPAGILALSGFLPTVEGFELDLAKARDLPVAIGHGTQRPGDHGGLRARRARPAGTAAGARVTYRESPMPHTIDPQYLRELQQTWLPETISAAAEQPADPVE